MLMRLQLHAEKDVGGSWTGCQRPVGPVVEAVRGRRSVPISSFRGKSLGAPTCCTSLHSNSLSRENRHLRATDFN